jgi:capsular polysaccharide biosynthesis protein
MSKENARKIIIQKQIVNNKLPVNIISEHEKFFSKGRQQNLPEVYEIEYKNVYVSYAGTVFSGLHTFSESVGDYYRTKLGLQYVVYNYVKRKKKKTTSSGSFLLVYNNLSDCYYHWLLEAIPRLFLVKEYLKTKKIILPDIYKGFQLATLKAFNIDIKDIEFIPSGSFIEVPELTMPSFIGKETIYNSNLLKEVRAFYISYYKSIQIPKETNDKFYIKRKKSSVRHIINDDEVINCLLEFGFKDIYFEDYTFDEQVSIAYNAKCLISIHGAGLTNMLFMNPGSKILEFRKSNEENYLHYYTLSSALELEYYYLFGTPQDEKISSKEANLHIDIATLKTTLIKMNL